MKTPPIADNQSNQPISPTDKATARPYPGQSDYNFTQRLLRDIDCCHRTGETSECRESAQEAMDLARQLVREHAALVAVAEAVESWISAINFPDNKSDVRRHREVVEGMLANLAAVRGQKETLNLYRTEARVTGMSEPMVDWYEAETEDAARKLFDEDCHRYGLPKEKTAVTIRLANERERAAFRG